MSSFSSSYVITNRNSITNTAPSNLAPASGGGMWFYRASGSYVCNAASYSPDNTSPSPTAPGGFLNSLVNDLEATKDANGVAHLLVFIHGLGDLFGNVTGGVANLGNYLATYGNYPGLVIGFDWPSYDGRYSAFHYASSPPPPTKTSGTIRDNINGSTPVFVNFLTLLQKLQSQMAQNQIALEVSMMCHSEGNYMMMLGMNAFAATRPSGFQINQVFLTAADINSAALDNPTSDPTVGWGSSIAAFANQVTIYYSKNDPALKASEFSYVKYHDPKFLTRLGLEGPNSFAVGVLPSNVVAVDCANVMNDTELNTLQSLGYLPSGITVHTLYMYTPQVLQDLTATIGGTPPGSVPNRIPQKQPDGQAYTMELVINVPKATITPCSFPSSSDAAFVAEAQRLAQEKGESARC